ncbi:MAG: DUF4126 domain-containing protein [Gammaproteobacteria bacterium]|nr:DUF4126 domain-containing protein [Gammaproteobacteria bacterium]MCI0590146.1 DUF4126 domain-containing protein [Gammaproteobacteria bacterium]
MGIAWASGINLYAAVFMLGLLGSTGHIALPADLEVLTDPLVMAAAGFMYCVEFFADKTPGVDTVWDATHSFIRIPAGAVLAMGAVGETSQAAQLAALLVGGSLAAATYATKAGSRVIINTSPEPFSNWTASLIEDLVVIGGIWTALHHPWVFLALLVTFILFMIWLLPKLWIGVKTIFFHIRNVFRRSPASQPQAARDVAEIDNIK